MKKNLYIPITVAILTVIFAIVSVLLYLRKNDARLIKYKLKIGKYLLLLNAMAVGAYAQEVDSTRFCYSMGASHFSNPKKYVFGINFSFSYPIIENFDYYPSALSPKVYPNFKPVNVNFGLFYNDTLSNELPQHKLSLKLNIKYILLKSKKEINSIDYKASVINQPQSKLLDKLNYQSTWISIVSNYYYEPFINSGLYFYLGFSLDQNLNSDFEETLEIDDKTNQTLFMTNDRILSLLNNGTTALILNDFANKNNTGFAINTGISYTIDNQSISISELYFEYNYYLTSVNNHNKWKNHYITFGINYLLF